MQPKRQLADPGKARGCSTNTSILSYIRKGKYRPATPTAATVYVTLRGPPLDSEMGWTGELWLNRILLILEN